VLRLVLIQGTVELFVYIFTLLLAIHNTFVILLKTLVTPGCLFQIYNGRVSSIMNFGCFVQLEGLKKKWEGLVHISQVFATQS
jgi:S1 RNA binding domain